MRKISIILSSQLALVSAIGADPLETWRLRSPSPFGHEVLDLAYGNGKFVAVGYYGRLATSSDGTTWVSQNTHAMDGHLTDVAVGNGVFVAANIFGTNVVSNDGVNWGVFPSPVNIEGLGFGNGMFLGGGYDPATTTFGIVSSANGTNWTRNATISGNITQILYSGGRYVATGYGGKIFVSTNLTDWSVSNTGGGEDHTGICFGNGIYVVVGGYSGAFVSSDAINWVQVATSGPPWLRDVAYVGGKFVAVGRWAEAMVSNDGTNWLGVILPHRLNIENDYNAITHGQGVWYAGGSRGQVSSSLNGTNWVSRFQGTIERLYGATCANDQWMAVGHLEEVISSGDGINWTTRRSQGGTEFSAIRHANGLFVACSAFQGLGGLFTSTDGDTWISQFVPECPPLLAVNHGQGAWVAVGAGGFVCRSETGTNWQVQSSGTTVALNGVACGDGKFVVVGSQGAVLTSPDGIGWTLQNSGTTEHLNDVVYGQGKFLAVGANGGVITSSNGVSWNIHGSIAPYVLTSVAFGDGYFVAVGFEGAILTSPDGWQWNLRASPTGLPLLSVDYGKHGFLAVGEGGVIVQSDPFIRLGIEKLGLSISGPTGSSVLIQGKSSLNPTSIWEPVITIPLTNDPTIWTSDLIPLRSSYFYRGLFVPTP